MKNTNKQSAFTLIELIIVIAIIATLAAAIFVAVDPAKRLNQSRNSRRATDITAILSAIAQYQVDNDGTHIPTIDALTLEDPRYYMIGTCLDGDLNTEYDTKNPSGYASPAYHAGSNAPAAGEPASAQVGSSSIPAVGHSIDNCTFLDKPLLGDTGASTGTVANNVSAFYDVDATDASTNAFCLDISALSTAGLLGKIPADPKYGSDKATRYFLQRKSNGAIEVGACEAEGEGSGGIGTPPDLTATQ